MALINCPECGKEISDKSQHCIHCGAELFVCPECGKVSVRNGNTCPVCGYEEGKKEEKPKAETAALTVSTGETQDMVDIWQNDDTSGKIICIISGLLSWGLLLACLVIVVIGYFMILNNYIGVKEDEVQKLLALALSLPGDISTVQLYRDLLIAFSVVDSVIGFSRDSYIRCTCATWLRKHHIDIRAKLEEGDFLVKAPGKKKDETSGEIYCIAISPNKKIWELFFGAVQAMCNMGLKLGLALWATDTAIERMKATVSGATFHLTWWVPVILIALMVVINVLYYKLQAGAAKSFLKKWMAATAKK